MTSKVLVFGGSGLVGSALKNIEPDWVYLSSKDGDLTKLPEVEKLFEKYQPEKVIFLAAVVGGLFFNKNNNYRIYMDNLKMQMNIIETCNAHKVTEGIFCLSTCVYPDKTEYPIKEEYLHNGPPHPSNYGYSYAKRNLEVMVRMSNETFGSNFKCIIPTNIYGEHDNFSLENGHVIPSLIHKGYLAKRDNKDFLIHGNGTPLRQFIYSHDIARLIVRILALNQHKNFILASTKEVSIGYIAYQIANVFGIPEDRVKFLNDSNGQMKKTVSNKEVLAQFSDFKFTTLEEGLINTVRWFDNNFEHTRK